MWTLTLGGIISAIAAMIVVGVLFVTVVSQIGISINESMERQGASHNTRQWAWRFYGSAAFAAAAWLLVYAFGYPNAAPDYKLNGANGSAAVVFVLVFICLLFSGE